jgi:hypothetical protein
MSELGCAPPAEANPSSAPINRVLAGLLVNSYCCPRARSASLPHSAGSPSCEQAVFEYVRGLSVAPPAAEAEGGSYGAILNRGSYFAQCGVPNSTGIDICVAILEGRAAGVTVRTTPVSPENAECVASSILHLTFPSNPRMDVARTKF